MNQPGEVYVVPGELPTWGEKAVFALLTHTITRVVVGPHVRAENVSERILTQVCALANMEIEFYKSVIQALAGSSVTASGGAKQ